MILALTPSSCSGTPSVSSDLSGPAKVNVERK
jgi:hypothetical protein